MKHSDQFVNGMDTIKGVHDDLLAVKLSTKSSKESVKFI